VTLKRLGGWRSSSVAESYIDESFEKKVGEKVAGSSMNRLLSSCETEASTSTSVTSYASDSFVVAVNEERESGFLFTGNSFQFATNCQIHFHVSK
jgi:hypothetical protein